MEFNNLKIDMVKEFEAIEKLSNTFSAKNEKKLTEVNEFLKAIDYYLCDFNIDNNCIDNIKFKINENKIGLLCNGEGTSRDINLIINNEEMKEKYYIDELTLDGVLDSINFIHENMLEIIKNIKIEIEKSIREVTTDLILKEF